MSLKCEPASEPLHISVKKLFMLRSGWRSVRREDSRCPLHLWRDKWTALSGPLSFAESLDETDAAERRYRSVCEVTPTLQGHLAHKKTPTP